MTENEFFKRYTYNSTTDLLGSGGFGSVFKAFDQHEQRYVAIKISQVKDIFGKFTLLNEVELSKNIDDHPNVARYESGLRVTQPFPADYAVMAYYEEGNLDMLLRKKHGILQSYEYREIVEGLLHGIAHLHNENVIHRDLKLANILLTRTKQGQIRPKIADFGLSRQTEGHDASMSNSAIGLTVAYAAPEQIECKPIRKNVDLWSFGVVLYRLLTGEMPFEAPQGMDTTSANLVISQKIVNLELPPKLNQIAEPYQTIIRQCWVKDPAKRVQTADELLEILRDQQVPTRTILSNENSDMDGLTQVLTSPRPPSVPNTHFGQNDTNKTLVDNPSSQTVGLKKSINTKILIGLGAFFALIVLFFVLKPTDEKIVEPKTIDTTVIDNAAFKTAQIAGTLDGYKNYLLQFPNGKNAQMASDSLQKLSGKFKTLLNDADYLIEANLLEDAKDYLKKAALISPNDTSVEKRLVFLKTKN